MPLLSVPCADFVVRFVVKGAKAARVSMWTVQALHRMTAGNEATRQGDDDPIGTYQ